MAVDTFMVGTLKGIGRIYLQSAIDCYSRYAWGRLYSTKLPVTAVQTLNNDVLSFFEKHVAHRLRLFSRITAENTVVDRIVIHMSCSCNLRGLNTERQRFVGPRVTASCSGSIGRFSMSISV